MIFISNIFYYKVVAIFIQYHYLVLTKYYINTHDSQWTTLRENGRLFVSP